MLAFIRRRVLGPIAALLLQGITPKQVALSIALGLVVGVFPVLGTTTVLCTLAAVLLRLNLVAVHAVHYAATPLQLLLIIPFVRAGELLTRAPAQPLSLEEGLALIGRGVGEAVNVLWDAIVHAVVGWLALAPIVMALAYFIAAWCLERMNIVRLRRSLPSGGTEQTHVSSR